MASITVEVPQEYTVQEIAYDGTEVRQNPPSMTESLTKLAHKIDFTDYEDGEEDVSKDLDRDAKRVDKEEEAAQPPQWQWESVRSKLRNALAEASVLLDVIHVSREKKYLVLDPVGQDAQPRRPVVQMLAKKKGLGTAAEILIRGADKLKLCQSEASRNRGVPNFHMELLKLRQNWRLKKVGNTIIGDLSFASSGSRFRQSRVFEVTKTEEADGVTGINGPGLSTQRVPPALKVTLPPELDCETYIEVIIQKDAESFITSRLSTPANVTRGSTGLAGLLDSPGTSDSTWQKKLENAQNSLFCKELFSQLAREVVCLPTSIPHMVVGNEITASLFPSIQLIIALRQITSKRSSQMSSSTSVRKPDHNHVLEHSLHQLLWETHFKQKHQSMPHPSTGPIGFTSKRRNAGPSAASRQTFLSMTKVDSLLDQIMKQARHVVLRLRTMYVIDTLTKEIKDPLIVAHWNALNSPVQSQVKISITSCGYEALSRTSLVITVYETSLKTVCRDGRVMTLSIEPQELRDLLLCQISQHQITAVQTLAKCHGWQSVSSSTFLGGIGLGPMEPLGNPSSCVLSSPRGGYRLLTVKCTPQRGFQVAISSVNVKRSNFDDSDASEESEDEEMSEMSKLEFFNNDQPEMMDFDDLLTKDLSFMNGATKSTSGGVAKRVLLFDSAEKGKKRKIKEERDEAAGVEKKAKKVYFKDLRHGPLKEIMLEKMEGKNYLNKIELIMACMSSGPRKDL